MKYRVLAGGLLCVAAAVFVYINGKPLGANAKTNKQLSQAKPQIKAQNSHTHQAHQHTGGKAWVHHKGEEALQNIHAHLQQIQQDAPHQKEPQVLLKAFVTGHTFAPQFVHHTQAAFTQMAKLRTHADKYRVRQQVIDKLLQNPQSISLASSVLLDNGFARKQYGEDQAVARIYSIQLLDRLMQKGNKQPLVKTIAALTQQLAAVPQDQQDKGRLRDLEDLLGHYFRREEVDLLKNQFEDVLEKMGYHINLFSEFELTSRVLMQRLDIKKEEHKEKYVSILLQDEE